MDQRTSERVVVDLHLKGTLVARALRVQVYDLSMDGCMVETEGSPLPEPGQTIELSFPHGALLSGKLAWTMGRSAGVQFIEPLHEAVVAHLAYKPALDRADFTDQFGRALPAARPIRRVILPQR